MRILDGLSDRPLHDVCLYLTPAEAAQLAFALKRLINDPADHHVHVHDADYKHEITVTIYRDDNLSSFDERSRRLIQDGE